MQELVPGSVDEWIYSIVRRGQEKGSSKSGNAITRASCSTAFENAQEKQSGVKNAGGRVNSPGDDSPSGDDDSPQTSLPQSESIPLPSGFIQLCIKFDRSKTTLTQPDIKAKLTDREIFESLKEEHKSRKPSWWRLSTLSHVEFKRVL